MNNIEELKKAALGANLHGWTGFEDALNDDGYSEAVSKFIGHCSPSAILALIAQLEAAQKRGDDIDENRKVAFELYQNTVNKLEAANEKLSKPIVLPAGYSVRAGHPINEGERNVMIPKEGGNWLSRFDVEHAIRVAGFTVEGE
ncbi:hypothetical protein [Yersinia enterocolitica]|uniref:hypothetical protein n=1 Tax=Yersinia enterocolitica TaxID=630 RepID=UPI003D08AE75|nr:hypothetical protein [Yersinia enterocolitica]EKN6092525.1 hypothetical protein [Yersinia enterocolitica]